MPDTAIETELDVDIDPEPATEPVVDDVLKFTQQQVSDMAAAEKAKATRATEKRIRKELADEYGMTPAEVQKLAVKKAADEEAKLGEVEKAKRETEEAKLEASKLRAEVLRERLDIRAERALLAAGVDANASARLIRLLDLDDDADDDSIADAVEQLKADMPQLFTETELAEVAPSGRSGVSRSGSQPPKNPVPVTTGVEAGRARFRNSSGGSTTPTPLERLQGKTA